MQYKKEGRGIALVAILLSLCLLGTAWLVAPAHRRGEPTLFSLIQSLETMPGASGRGQITRILADGHLSPMEAVQISGQGLRVVGTVVPYALQNYGTVSEDFVENLLVMSGVLLLYLFLFAIVLLSGVVTLIRWLRGRDCGLFYACAQLLLFGFCCGVALFAWEEFERLTVWPTLTALAAVLLAWVPAVSSAHASRAVPEPPPSTVLALPPSGTNEAWRASASQPSAAALWQAAQSKTAGNRVTPRHAPKRCPACGRLEHDRQAHFCGWCGHTLD